MIFIMSGTVLIGEHMSHEFICRSQSATIFSNVELRDREVEMRSGNWCKLTQLWSRIIYSSGFRVYLNSSKK